MSSSGSGEQRRTQRPVVAEAHLGDRLAAFVDGELSGDTRDRVAAHLATCQQCKWAAAEQRRLKRVMAGSELPAISAGLLARLQGLPGMDCGDGPGGMDGRGPEGADAGGYGHRRGPFDGGFLGRGGTGGGFASRGGPDDTGMPEIPDAAGTVVPVPAGAPGGGFSYLDPVADLVPGGDGQPRGRGFRIHDSTSRGRRFAFAAAGAFSMAAIAIGSTLPMEAAMDGGARPDDGPAVIPVTAGQVSDTRGTTPRGVLESERQERRQSPSVGASATSVALAGSLLAGGVVPLSAAPTAAPAAVALAAGQQAAETASAARQADTAAASSGSSALPR